MNNNVIHKFMVAFLSAIVVAGIGVIVGQFVPSVFILPLAIAELVLVIVVAFSRKTRLGYFLMYLFMLISGITLYVTLNFYVGELGGDIVFKTFVVAVITFCIIAVYGSVTKFNFGFLGNALFFVLLAIVVIGIVGIFVQFSYTMHLWMSIAGVLLFALYTLYDFNQIAKNGMTEDEIPSMVINVYLDLVNLFVNMLKAVWSLKNLLDD